MLHVGDADRCAARCLSWRWQAKSPRNHCPCVGITHCCPQLFISPRARPCHNLILVKGADNSCWRLLPLGHEDSEPPPGADPGHPPYEGGVAAVRGGVSWGIKIRT